MSSKTLIFIRHGKAGHNLGLEKEQRFAGSAVDDELTPEGKKNATDLLAKIIKYGKYKQIYTSSLKRSIETAEIIARGINCPIKILKELDEINIGRFAGYTEEEVRKLFPEAAEKFYSGDIKNWFFPDGENFTGVAKRAKKALKKIEESMKDGEKVIVSGHGMINRLMFYLLEPGRTGLWKPTSYPHGRIEVLNIKK